VNSTDCGFCPFAYHPFTRPESASPRPAQLTKTPRPAPAPPPAEVVIDVKQAYGGVTFRTIGRAMAEAVRALHGGSSCTVFLAAGQKRPCR
jgi:hypothetical protein